MGRGKKKWLPFKALSEQDYYLKNVYKKHQPIKLEKNVDEIENFLRNYNSQAVAITYKKDNYIHNIEGIILKIDIFNQSILVNNTVINLDNVINLKYIE